MKEKIKGVLQLFAGAMMVPIIVLVAAGFCVGFGAPIAMLMPQGSIFQAFFNLLSSIGSMIMNNTPLWFVIGISFGLAKQEKGWAAFSGFVMFMFVNTVIGKYASFQGWDAQTTTVDHLMNTLHYTLSEAQDFNQLWTTIAGMFTMNTSIFGSIIIALVTVWLHNRLYDCKLPNAFSYFAGPRAVIILAPLVAIVLGIALYYVWPYVAMCMRQLASFITSSGLFGTFLYGVADRSLLPFGLHHLVTLPLKYSYLGGSMVVDGVLYEGVANINTALVASADAVGLLVRNFESGRILSNFGSLTGAGLAMYVCAKKENRKKAAAILIPTVLTAFLVGITEPIEFTILFASPALYYLVHVPLSGLAFVLTELTQVSIQGFAAIFMIPNLLQPDKVHAMSLLILIPLFFLLYFVIFRWAIIKFDIPTPGRRDNTFRLAGKKEIKAHKQGNKDQVLAMEIVENMGGKTNILSVENCATRLRVTLADRDRMAEDALWHELGAMGVVRNGNQFQIIFGPQVMSIATAVKQYLQQEHPADQT